MRKLFRCVNIVFIAEVTLLLSLCYSGFKLLTMLLLPIPVFETQVSAHSLGLAQVREWKWFGQFDGNAINIETLRGSTLKAQLLGLVGSAGSDNRVALIQLDGQAQKVYRIGDKLSANARLSEIFSDRVVIRENGVLTSLAISRMQTKKTQRALSQRVTNKSDRTSVTEVLQLSGMARAVPVTVQGKVGMKLEDLSEEIEALSSLKKNDVLMSIDGQDVTSLMANNNWQSLLTKTDAQISVNRNGQATVVQVNIATLTQQMLRKIQTQ